MATKRRRKTGRSSKVGNEKLIAAIITVLLAIFGFAYNGVNSGFGKKRAKTSNSKKIRLQEAQIIVQLCRYHEYSESGKWKIYWRSYKN